VRVAAGGVARQPNGLEELAHAQVRLAPVREPVGAERLADDPADAMPRVERRERVLEDHLHAAPQRPQLPVAELGDVSPVEDDAAVSRLVEPQDRPADGRLAAAGLADETERLPATDRQRHVVDGADVADVAVEDEPALDREVLLQVLQLDERPSAVAGIESAHAVAATRVRSHSSAGTGLKQASL
jgi:hypothetical protein